VIIDKLALMDLYRVKEEFDSIMESLELSIDKEFMSSYQEAKIQIQKKEFVDWNEL
jgi:hypothetical protein